MQHVVGALLCTCAVWPTRAANSEHISLDRREVSRAYTSRERLRGELWTSLADAAHSREQDRHPDREKEPEDRTFGFKTGNPLGFKTGHDGWKAFGEQVCLRQNDKNAWWRMFGGLWHLSIKNACSLFYGWKNEQGGSIGATDYKKQAEGKDRSPIADAKDVPDKASEAPQVVTEEVTDVHDQMRHSKASHSSGLPLAFVLTACLALAWVSESPW